MSGFLRCGGGVIYRICAWCQQEGRTTVLEAGDPELGISHGICPAHRAELRSDLARSAALKATFGPEYVAGVAVTAAN